MKELLISFLIALVAGSFINSCSQGQPPAAEMPADQQATIEGGQSGEGPGPQAGEPGASPVQEVTEANFNQEVLSSPTPVLVEFGAKWCVPCKKMAPILEKLASEYQGRLKVVSVDVDENHNLADQYTQSGLPTFVIFQGGRAREMTSGYMPEQGLLALVKPHLG